MNNSLDPEEPDYQWYQLGNWTALRQGDLLTNCPVLHPPANLPVFLQNRKQEDTPKPELTIQFADLIILSQSCDLENDKINQVLLCSYVPASNYSKGDKNSIRKEQRPALHMIERCEIPGHGFEKQVIDFRTIYTLPKEFVISHAISINPRIRLLPPYREHLSQAFARYFMRVGLPRPLKDE